MDYNGILMETIGISVVSIGLLLFFLAETVELGGPAWNHRKPCLFAYENDLYEGCV